MPCELAKIACFTGHVLPRILRSRRDGDQGYGCCPWHDDSHASFSIKIGTTVRFVWFCESGCDPADIRFGMLRLGGLDDCLGTYGTSRRPGHGERDDSDAKKLLDIGGVLTGPGTTPAMVRMQIGNIIEGRGRELPRVRADVIGLAARWGVGTTQRYEAWKALCLQDGWGESSGDPTT